MSDTIGRGSFRPMARLGAAAFVGLVLATGTAGAVERTTDVGAWDLSLEDGSRQCRVTLRSEPAQPGYAVAMPVGCHRAFPVLSTVAIWIEVGEGKLQFDDSSGQPVLDFESADDGGLKATSPGGEIYRLRPVGQHKPVVLKAAMTPQVAASASAIGAPQRPLAKKLPPPPLADMAGHYAVLRDKTKDTGCMVTLDDKAHGAKGDLKANLAPACRDQGIVIFDPVGWQLQGGRLVLTARKGHTTHLDLQEDGSWIKDPKEGKSLSLKKI